LALAESALITNEEQTKRTNPSFQNRHSWKATPDLTPVFQTKFTYPEGNCFQACLASILNLELGQVPYFEGGNQYEYSGWLNQNHGIVIRSIGYSPYTDTNADQWLEGLGYLIASVESKSGCEQLKPGNYHAVVMHEGVIVHDPNNSYEFEPGSYNVVGLTLFLKPMVDRKEFRTNREDRTGIEKSVLPLTLSDYPIGEMAEQIKIMPEPLVGSSEHLSLSEVLWPGASKADSKIGGLRVFERC
jgi:hypothetical protein